MLAQDDSMNTPVEIPYEKLSTDVLDALIEEFILREGTDYGAEEVSLGRKKEQVYRQLAKQDIKIVFDPNMESATLMTRHTFSKLSQN